MYKMRSILIGFVFLLVITSCVSASDIIISQQPREAYNYGDVVSIPIKVSATSNLEDFFTIHLLCNNMDTEVYREYLVLDSGEEKKVITSIPLKMSFIQSASAYCKLKAKIGELYKTTNEFKISDVIKIELYGIDSEIQPGKGLIIDGNAKRYTGSLVNGFVEFKVSNLEGVVVDEIIETVDEGYFSVNLSIDDRQNAGMYRVNVRVYEKDGEEITNEGVAVASFRVLQISDSLELVAPDVIEPGTNLEVKGIMRDQSGEKMNASIIITIKDIEDRMITQIQKKSDEFMSYSVPSNEPINEWQIIAVAEGMSNEKVVEILENSDVNIQLINQTVVVTNIGNVLYERPVSVKIGSETVYLNTSLELGESKTYLLSAPEGNYQVQVLAEGEEPIAQHVTLTGNVVDVEESSEGVITLMRHPISWIFIIFLLGSVALIVARKGYQRTFIGYIHKKRKSKNKNPGNDGVHEFKQENKTSVSEVSGKNKAELLLSIKGDKFDSVLVCLKLKNSQNLNTDPNLAYKSLLQRLVNFAERNKAATYINGENIFFVLTPLLTKTFDNEKKALEIGMKLQEALNEYNKLAKYKIEFGISVEKGSLVVRKDGDKIQFMPLGMLMNNSRKVASLSEGEVLFSGDIKSKLGSSIKSKKFSEKLSDVFKIEEVKKKNEEHEKYIKRVLDDIEKDKK